MTTQAEIPKRLIVCADCGDCCGWELRDDDCDRRWTICAACEALREANGQD